jgi:hypothetical protein
MKFPSNREELLDVVKLYGWTTSLVVLSLMVFWQGLTLYQYVQSWSLLEKRVQGVLGGDSLAKKKDQDQGPDGGRSVDATFFYRPEPSYVLSALINDRAVINGKEVKVGDQVEKAVVEKIDLGSVTLREEGADTPRVIQIHPGI